MNRLAVLLLVLACACARAEPPLTPRQFAWSFTIDAARSAPLQRAALTEAVYASTARGELADLRVFNADHEMLPHAIVAPRAAEAAPREPLALALFPLRGPQAVRTGGPVSISVDAQGALIQLPDAQPRGERVQAWLMDAGRAHADIAALRLDWVEDAPDFVASVTLESSADLRTWRAVGSATLASLAHAGQRLGQHEIRLDAPPERYLRLAWPESAAAVELLQASGVPAPAAAEQARQWTRAEGAPAADAANRWDYDTGAWLPADRLRAGFAQPNSMATLRVWSRADPAAPWRERTEALFYRLQADGAELRAADVALDRLRQRYWRVESREPLAAAPVLELGWVPDEMVFVARGRAPFRLAAGSAAAGAAAQPVEQLLASFPAERREALTGAATLGPRGVLAGPDALVPAPPPVPWQRFVLWALLVGAVLLLLGMAWRLYRQMGAPPAAP